MTKRIASKVLLIGWDAADWDVARQLMSAGQLPHLKRLAEDGASGDLASLQPMLSPMLWTSIATGKYPHKHGIHGFTEPCPDGYGIRPASSTSRTAKAIWNILSQSGLRTHQIGWYASHPAEPINGISVSNHLAVAPTPNAPWPLVEGTVYPPSVADELSELRLRPEEVGLNELGQFIPSAAQIDPASDDRLLKCAVIIAETATTHAAATWAIEREPWDFMAVLYDGLDHFGHMFMDYHPPKLPWISSSDFEHYQHVMAKAYSFHDMMLGRLLELAGEDAVVILVSDHGFCSGEDRPRQTVKTLEGLSRWHRPAGICVMHGPGVRQGVRLEGASLLDVTPTILSLFGVPIGQDMDGRPWLEAIEFAEPADSIPSWEQTPGDAGLHAAELRQSNADSLQVLRHLINLGYLAPASTDIQAAIDETLDTNQFNLARSLIFAGEHDRGIEILTSLVQKHPHNEDFREALSSATAASHNR
jgi:predicted AlkP superfamily phosphohydrolase/phosphomutase